MSDVSALFVRETVEISAGDGPLRVPAWRYQDMAVHDGIGPLRGRWVITHLPTGLSFSRLGVFERVESAWTTAVAIARLRNDWTQLERDDLQRIADVCAPVFAAHGALSNPRPSPKERRAADRAFERRLNGYAFEGRAS